MTLYLSIRVQVWIVLDPVVVQTKHHSNCSSLHGAVRRIMGLAPSDRSSHIFTQRTDKEG
jgi:hypothetical protein